MKGIVLLLLTLQGYAEVINNCGEDKRFRVIKSNGNYTLELCISRDNCTELINFISSTDEKRLCDYCRQIIGTLSEDCYNETTCEAHLDSFFSDYCENAAFDQCTTSPSTQQLIIPTTRVPLATFGALTGLLLVILVLVTIGWVWTCWTLKNRSHVCTKCQDQEEEEQSYMNTISDTTTSQPAEDSATEQQLHSQEDNGHIYNVLNRDKQ